MTEITEERVRELRDNASDGPSKKMKRFCHKCYCERRGPVCHKCNNATTEVPALWTPRKEPDVAKIREIAKQYGYAIGEHGSRERDIDLIAAPWAEDAVPATTLIYRIAKELRADVLTCEKKPLGRMASNIVVKGGNYKVIDLSVCPRS